MNFTTFNKHACLYAREDSRLDQDITPEDDHYLIEKYPIAEMMGKTPQEIAEEFIKQSLTPEWLFQLRRQVHPGDAFTYNNQIYIFLKPDDATTQWKFPGSVILDLANLTYMKILQLGDNTCKELISRGSA